MKILLFNPPFHRFMGREQNYPHLGLAYLGTHLEHLGHDVTIRNLEMPLNDHLGYIGYNGLMRAHQDYLYGLRNKNHLIWQEVTDAVEMVQPGVVGITARSVQVKSALRVAQLVKACDDRIRVVVGGVHATARPQDFDGPYVDDVIQGEGESQCHKFVYGSEKNKPIPAHGLPIPNRGLFMEQYGLEGLGHMITATGCPFKCAFCAQSVVWGNNVKLRGPGDILTEMELLNQEYGVQDFTFWDDSFTVKRERVLQLCRELADYAWADGWRWRCDTRLDLLDGVMMASMLYAGCRRVSVGVESGSSRILEMAQKGECLDSMRQKANILRTAQLFYPDFKWRIYVIVGFPTETDDEIKATWDLAIELEPDRVCLSTFTFYPGTVLYEEGLRRGWISDDHRWEEHSHQSSTDRAVVKEFAQWVDEYNEERGGWEAWKGQ